MHFPPFFDGIHFEWVQNHKMEADQCFSSPTYEYRISAPNPKTKPIRWPQLCKSARSKLVAALQTISITFESTECVCVCVHAFHLHAVVTSVGIVIIPLNVSIFEYFTKFVQQNNAAVIKWLIGLRKRPGIKLVLNGLNCVCDCRWNPSMICLKGTIEFPSYNLISNEIFLKCFLVREIIFVFFSFCHIHLDSFASSKVRHVFSLQSESKGGVTSNSSSRYHRVAATAAIAILCGCNQTSEMFIFHKISM